MDMDLRLIVEAVNQHDAIRARAEAAEAALARAEATVHNLRYTLATAADHIEAAGLRDHEGHPLGAFFRAQAEAPTAAMRGGRSS